MLLLDANVIVWWMIGDKRLGPQARKILASSEADLIISLLTLFEIELKRRSNKLRLPASINDFLEEYGVEVYRPFAGDLTSMMDIELNHTDPFDCALIGLANLKKWTVMTSDDPLINMASNLVTIIDTKK